MPQTSPTLETFAATFLAQRAHEWNRNWKIDKPHLWSSRSDGAAAKIAMWALHYRNIVARWHADRELWVCFSIHPTEPQCAIANEILRQAGIPDTVFAIRRKVGPKYPSYLLLLNGEAVREREFMLAQGLGAMAIIQQAQLKLSA